MQVVCGPHLIVLDAGTGIRRLGRALDQRGAHAADLFVSHHHMDHLQGFPFFSPAYRKDFHLRIHVPSDNGDLPSAPFEHLMKESAFPVAFEKLPARIECMRVSTEFRIGDTLVRSLPVNHPGGCAAFRIEHAGQAVVYITDHEPWTRQYPDAPDAAERDAVIRDFLRGADLAIREAQYAEEEYGEHRGWGHGTFDDALADALAADVRRLAIFHHDPEHDDAFLEGQLARLIALRGGAELEIFLAREGQTVELAG